MKAKGMGGEVSDRYHAPLELALLILRSSHVVPPKRDNNVEIY